MSRFRLFAAIGLLDLAVLSGGAWLVVHGTSFAEAFATPALVKGRGPAVYYVPGDGKKYPFPNQAVFDSWYAGIRPRIVSVSDADLAAYPMGPYVLIRPGSRLVRLPGEAKVYAVSRYGVLRWVTSPSLAKTLFGSNWPRLVIDLAPESALIDGYQMGSPIRTVADYDRFRELAISPRPKDTIRPTGVPPAPAPTSAGPITSSDQWMNADQKRRAMQITSIFENGTPEIQYAYVENINDGRGYTSGRAGFTTATGDAALVIQRYNALKPNNALAKYLPRVQQLSQQGSGDVNGLEGYAQAWVASASDPLFRRAQDEIVDELYYRPAMQAADRVGVTSAIGRAIFFDTIIQHGGGDDPDSLGSIVNRTTAQEGGTPANGKDEVHWLHTFLAVRRDVLTHATDPDTREAWAASAGRVDVLSGLLSDPRNRSLAAPLRIDTNDYQGNIP